jgi:hypothetical protein
MTVRLQPGVTLIWASLLGVTACAGHVAEPQIRAASSGSSAPLGSIDKGHFLLEQGQYGLAIDEFRKALRVDPDNVASVEGLARSYDRLGREDLSDRYYQQALALAPRNARLYADYAASLRRHGRGQDAVNLEADLRAIDTPAMASKAPAVAVATPRTTALAAPAASSAPIAGADPERPYLRRESLTEVILVTTSPSRPSASARPIVANEIAVPQARLQLPTRVVNAVGRRGIATRYIGVLARKGWSGVEAGDAVFKLERSQVMCPPDRCAEAAKLAATLPFRIRATPSAKVSRILVLLGKDALGADPQARAADRG